MRRFAPRLLACALMGAGVAQAEPFTVEHFLNREQLGKVSIDPSQRWLVAPVVAPYRTAPRWDLEDWSTMTISQLRVFDLAAGGAPRVFPAKVGGPDDWGYSPGPYSPSGAKMAVTRARGRTLEVGVLTLATGQTVWTGLYPINDQIGRAMQWRSDDTLLVVAQDPAAPIMSSLSGWQVEARWAQAWRDKNEGRASVTVTGSGRYLGVNPTTRPTRLVSVDAATGQGQVLVEGDFLDLEVAPGGGYAALWTNGETLAADSDKPLSTTDSFRRHRLTLVDLSRSESFVPCKTCDLAPYLMGWAPDGRQLLVYARSDGEAWSQAAYWRIDADRRSAARLDGAGVKSAPGRNAPGELAPQGDWMGATPLVLGQKQAAEAKADADWYALAGGAAVNLTARLPAGPRRLEAVSPTTLIVSVKDQLFGLDGRGRARPLGKGRRVEARDLASQRLTLNNRPAPADLIVTKAEGDAQVPAIFRNNRLTMVGRPLMSEARLASVAPAAQAVVTIARDDHGVETVSLDQGPRPARAIAVVNASLAKVAFAPPTPITHKGHRGETLTSWLYLPPQPSQPGARLPLLVIPYPGGVYDTPPRRHLPPTAGSDTNAQILAGHGYAVLVTSLPVDETREPADGLSADILKIVDAAITAEPRIDGDRLALWGHSYGGWAALTTATQTQRFKAVIAGAFVANRFSFYSPSSLLTTIAPDAGLIYAAQAGYSENGQARMGKAPWLVPDRYMRNSPLMAADKITTPMLLLMGDLDSDPGQQVQMFGALFRQNKDALSVLYHGEGHVLMSPAHVTDLYQRVFAFLDEQLRPSS